MKKILIIEDERAIAETLAEYLYADGYEIMQAYTGEDGLLALGDRPDCVLLDLNLPDMHGFDMLRHIADQNMGCGGGTLRRK